MGMLIRAGEEEKDRIDNIGELISTARQYEESTETPSLSEFLEDVALVSDVDRYDETANAVILMTIHSAKGLEFPIVFLPGMEEGVFPGYQAQFNPSEIEEERRLAYVAITRAKRSLYLISTHERMQNGSTQYNPPSRFLGEIPEGLCRVDEERAPRISYKFTDDGAFYTKRPRTVYTADRQSAPKKPSPTVNVVKTFSEGDRVRHSTFGAGTILTVKKMGADTLYEIEFDKVGKKKLMATYARLTTE